MAGTIRPAFWVRSAGARLPGYFDNRLPGAAGILLVNSGQRDLAGAIFGVLSLPAGRVRHA
jgi:hypothetical protein